LIELAANDSNVGVLGSIKEIGIIDEELLHFQQKCFRYPIYSDPKWNVYKAMGDREFDNLPMVYLFLVFRPRMWKKEIKNAKTIIKTGMKT